MNSVKPYQLQPHESAIAPDHRIASFKKKINHISGLFVNNSLYFDDWKIRDEFLRFYKKLMGSSDSIRFTVDWEAIYGNDSADLSILDEHFSLEEIRNAVIGLPAD